MQPTAVRSEASITVTSSLSLQFALDLASGG